MSSTGSSLTATQLTTNTLFTPTSTTAAPTTSDTPFFPDPSTPIQPSSTGISNDDGDGGLVKTVLEWLFLVVALITMALIIAWRFLQLKQHNRPLTEFFTRRRRRPTSYDSTGGIRGIPRTGLARVTVYPDSGVHTYYPYLVPPTTAHTYQTRRTRGADVDALGRRAGGRSDYDDLGDKDELPAYEHAGGPPKYVDLEVGRTGLVEGHESESHPPIPPRPPSPAMNANGENHPSESNSSPSPSLLHPTSNP